MGKVYWPSWVARDLALFTVLATFTLASPWPHARTQQPENAKTKVAGDTAAAPADQQRQSALDRELARKIRRAVVTDKSLSMYAQNIKIIAQNGEVTLKGMVRSEQERSTVLAKATEIAGAGKVKDEMRVKAKS
jgi:osmotically-inducible protein OsmY